MSGPLEGLRVVDKAMADVPADAHEMTLSVVRANTLGSAWFDGVTPVAGRPRSGTDRPRVWRWPGMTV